MSAETSKWIEDCSLSEGGPNDYTSTEKAIYINMKQVSSKSTEQSDLFGTQNQRLILFHVVREEDLHQLRRRHSKVKQNRQTRAGNGQTNLKLKTLNFEFKFEDIFLRVAMTFWYLKKKL